MNQQQQAERAVRIGRSAARRIAAHDAAETSRGDDVATYVWLLALSLRTVASWQAMIGRHVAELTTELRSDRRTRETVSELLAWVRLSNASITDYFAIVEAKTTRTIGTRSGYVTTECLSAEALWAMAHEWNVTHGERAHVLVMRNIARHKAELASANA